MNKALVLFLILAGLAAFVSAADVQVSVGGANGENVFEPAMVVAAPGDNIVFTWKSGKHSILQTDAAKSCAKSASATAFTSGGAFETGKTWTLPAPKETGKWWFYCGVPGHCVPGTGGMEGTLVVTADGKAPAGGDAPKDGAKDATPSGSAAPSGSPAAAGAASHNSNSLFSAGVVFSSMCMAAAYML